MHHDLWVSVRFTLTLSVRRLMRLMGLDAIYQAPRTSTPHPAHRIYPYLLKGMAIDRPNQVWCAGITHTGAPMNGLA